MKTHRTQDLEIESYSDFYMHMISEMCIFFHSH